MDFNSWQVEFAVSTPRESRPMLMKLHLICFAASFVLTFLPPFRSLASRISNFINLKYPQTTGVAVQQQQQKNAAHTISSRVRREPQKQFSSIFYDMKMCSGLRANFFILCCFFPPYYTIELTSLLHKLEEIIEKYFPFWIIIDFIKLQREERIIWVKILIISSRLILSRWW